MSPSQSHISLASPPQIATLFLLTLPIFPPRFIFCGVFVINIQVTFSSLWPGSPHNTLHASGVSCFLRWYTSQRLEHLCSQMVVTKSLQSEPISPRDSGKPKQQSQSWRLTARDLTKPAPSSASAGVTLTRPAPELGSRVYFHRA